MTDRLTVPVAAAGLGDAVREYSPVIRESPYLKKHRARAPLEEAVSPGTAKGVSAMEVLGAVMLGVLLVVVVLRMGHRRTNGPL